MAAATGVNVGAINDLQQKGCLRLTAHDGHHQDCSDHTPPTFLVTQRLVSLLTEKGVHCYSSDRSEFEANGEIIKVIINHSVSNNMCLQYVLV